MYRNQLEQVRHNSGDLAPRAQRILEKRRATAEAAAAFPTEMLDMVGEMPGVSGPFPGQSDTELVPEALGFGGLAEAIVLAELRPAFFVRADGIDTANAIEADPDLLAAIEGNRDILGTSCKSVGRIDLINHFTLPYAGTGFLIDDDLVVTNRHVAVEFAQRLQHGYRFRKGRFGNEIEARMDYRRFLDNDSHLRADVQEVLYIARDYEPDFALLRVAPLPQAPKLDLLGQRPTLNVGDPVAVIGYPAEDGERNDQQLMDEVFRGKYRVKRFAPGFLSERSDNGVVLMADYSSLGGNSGSPVVSLANGRLQGLHFAGRFMENNYAVAADVVEAARRQIMTQVTVPPLPTEAPTTKAEAFAGRSGYDPEFLGAGPLAVPLPCLGAWEPDAAPVEGGPGIELKYQNFSVVQSASRRLPLLTVVNIDGAEAIKLKRKGSWRLDGRLAEDHQIGNELYRHNPFDRGHMVRRRDPGWGAEAQQAELDTFHYTNCVPQHENLNQRDWVGLEDYVLEAAETHGFRATVLTGPVFRPSDKTVKPDVGAGGVQIPEEFWKVVVMVHAQTGALSATGYVLSHGPMIRDLVESVFVYGRYKTYQVRIALIARETGLDFGALTQADPMGADAASESAFSAMAHPVDGPQSLRLSPAATG